MSSSESFLWGLGGSIAVEIVAAVQYFHAGRAFPTRYSKFWFYVVRLALAFIGGGLAVAYKLDSAIVAINIGASTPLIIQAFAQAPPVSPVASNTATTPPI